MTRSIQLLTTLACIAALTGCAGHLSAQDSTGALAGDKSTQHSVPVFVVPNCLAMAGEQRCQWIEPRGYQPGEPEKQSAQRVQGIAL